MEPINLTKIGPVVDLTFVGEVHIENERLMAAIGKWARCG